MKTLDSPAIEQGNDSVSALHALPIVHASFYLEEVEELYTQDAVFAGRRLHAELEKQEDEEGRTVSRKRRIRNTRSG